MDEAAESGGEDSGVTLLGPLGAEAPLVEALVDVIVVADHSGRILYTNRMMEALLGWRPSELRGRPVTTLIPPRYRPTHQAAFDAYVAGGPPSLMGHPLRVAALTARGSEVQVELLLSSLPMHSGGELLVATLRNVAERIDLERRSHVVERLLDILAGDEDDLERRIVEVVGESLDWDAAALWMVDPGPRTLQTHDFWSRPGIDLSAFRTATESTAFAPGVGLPGRILTEGRATWIPDLELEPGLPRSRAAKEAGLRSGFAFPVAAGSHIIGVIELFARQHREPDEPLLDAMGIIGERVGEILQRAEAARERRRLLEELEAAQQVQSQLVRAQDFLLGAARVLADADDYAETLEGLASVAVPVLGDLCLIDVLTEDGNLVRMGARHADPAKRDLVEELHHNYPPDPDGDHPSADVIRTGRSRWSADMPEDFLRRTTRDERHLALVQELEFTSYMSVPLIAGDRALGSLTLVSAGSGRRFTERDLALAEELAGQAAAVIDRAQRHDREREAAHELQRSLLPAELPRLPGAATAARYLPGTEGADVGGDWYDVIPLSGGGLGIAIGDVAGHDIRAAAVMGQFRNAMRAYAVRDGRPGSVLDELRRFCDVAGVARMATAVYASFMPGTGELRVASAGHPAPLILRGSGEVEAVDIEPVPPLGVGGSDASPTPEIEATLDVGDILLLFSDGLVETREAGLAEGVSRLIDALPSTPGRQPAVVCDHVIEQMLGSKGRADDVVVLALRRVR